MSGPCVITVKSKWLHPTAQLTQLISAANVMFSVTTIKLRPVICVLRWERLDFLNVRDQMFSETAEFIQKNQLNIFARSVISQFALYAKWSGIMLTAKLLDTNL